MRYIVIDADGLITNTIEWDGAAEWAPPDGYSAVQSDDAQGGGTWKNGTYTPPPTPEPVPVAPTFEALVAQASTFDELKALVLAQGA